jgi:hypothetical protein
MVKSLLSMYMKPHEVFVHIRTLFPGWDKGIGMFYSKYREEVD